MMHYIKRRFSSGDALNESPEPLLTQPISSRLPHSRQSAPESELMWYAAISKSSRRQSSHVNPSASKEQSKLLLVIDDSLLDWSQYFRNRKLFADYDIHVEQAEFKEMKLSAHSDGGVLITINVYRNGTRVVRSFQPDFVLVRQAVKDVDVDWINIILGMQYGAVPSINSMRALYNFRDKPWIFAELLKIQRRLGDEQFPVIRQAYYPNHRKMFISPPYPSVMKVGHAHQGLGKIKLEDSEDYRDVTNLISISDCYSTIEPYIDARCDICIQKIGHHYKAFSRRSLTGNWKTNVGLAILEQIEMTDRYRFWIDEVSQIFGGLDICALELVQSKTGREYLTRVNDSTMQLLGDAYEEDCQAIADLIVHKMQIYCRPDQQRTVLTRIPSFDELPKLLPSNPSQTETKQRTSNSDHMNKKLESTLTNFKSAVIEIFRDIIS